MWLTILLLGCEFAQSQTAQVPATSVPLFLPSAIAYDSSGRLYIAESEGHTVRRVDASGSIASFAGNGTQGFGGDGGPAVDAHLNSPRGVVLDATGNVYIADSGNQRIRRIDAVAGIITTIAGTGEAGFAGDGGAATQARLNLPRAICVDKSGTNLYVADFGNNRIRHIDLRTGTINTTAGNGVQGFSGDNAPAALASLDSPDGIAIDLSGNLYVADTHNQRVRRIAAVGKTITTILGTGSAGAAAAGAQSSSSPLFRPSGLVTDAAGNLYIADSGNHRIIRVDHATGAVSIAAGNSIQAYGGDGGVAISAALNSPRAVTLTPNGLPSIADTGNQRVRQLLSDPAPPTGLQTVAGIGAVTPGILTISAPTVLAYGTGTLTASINANAPAMGQITFLDVGDTSSSVIGTSVLSANSASISLSALSVGKHRVMATYPGFGNQPAAQTSTTVITIAPITLRVTPAPATMVYGTPLPTLSGAMDGLLPQDSARVVASFATTATSLSPVGSYPIIVNVSGPGTQNYTLQPGSANLAITQARSIVSLRNSIVSGSAQGSFEARVSSSTTGTPSGVVTLSDNSAPLQTSALPADGSVLFTQLTPGTHVLSAVYSGDRNFLPSASSAMTVSIAPPAQADFTIAAMQPTSQLLASGSSVTYTLNVQMIGGGLPSKVALSASGLPAFTTASFSPNYLIPGSPASNTVVLTISSTASAALRTSGGVTGAYQAAACAAPILFILCRRRGSTRQTKLPTLVASLLLFVISATLSGCGDRVNSAAQANRSLQTYNLTVTGTGTDVNGSTVQHTAKIVLQTSSAQ